MCTYCSIRALYGVDVIANAIHASSNMQRAMDEVKVVFPDIEFNADGTLCCMKRAYIVVIIRLSYERALLLIIIIKLH